MEMVIATRFAAGCLPDQDAFWSHYRSRLIVFVRGFGGAVSESPEDIAQDIVERAISRIGQYDDLHAFSTWLYRLARNHCIDVNSKKKRRAEIFGRHAFSIYREHRAQRGPQEQLERLSTVALVARAVRRLQPEDRQIAFLRYFEELPISAISNVMGKPVGTVKYRLHVIVHRLREDLEEVAE